MSSEEMPYSGMLKKGDITCFLFNGNLIPVQIDKVGWDTIDIVSLELEYRWTIQKSKWLRQLEIMHNDQKETSEENPG